MQINTSLIITMLIILGVFGFLVQNTQRQNNILSKYEQNLKALNDSVRSSSEKNEQVYSKYTNQFNSINEMKKQMPELFQEIKGLKNQKNITHVTNTYISYTDTIINIPTTAQKIDDNSYELSWLYQTPDGNRVIEGKTYVDIIKELTKIQYDSTDTNKFFTYEKFINLNPKGTDILKDELKIKLTVGLRKNKGYDEIFVIPHNENIIISDIKGAKIERKKQRWSIGPYIGAGIGYYDNKITPNIQIGVGLQQNILKF